MSPHSSLIVGVVSVAQAKKPPKCPLASQKHDSNIIYSSSGCDGKKATTARNENYNNNYVRQHEATDLGVLAARFKRFTDFFVWPATAAATTT